MFLRVFDETIGFTLSRKDDKVTDVGDVVSREDTENGADSAVELPQEPEQRAKRSKAKVGVKEDVYNFLDDSQLVIQYPASLSAESFHELEDYVALFLRKMRRMVDAQAQSTFSKVDEALSTQEE